MKSHTPQSKQKQDNTNVKMNTVAKIISRREALKVLGTGTLGLFVAANGIGTISGCTPKKGDDNLNVGYRTDKKSGNKVSLLGFGCMRFPLKSDHTIDEEVSQRLIDYAYEHGVNYYDTAFNYLRGQSEPFVGKALKKYPRESLYIATKMPTWLITSLEKGKEIFQTQLDRLQTSYIDYYLLHALGSKDDFDRVYKNSGVLDYLKSEKAAGRIKRLGFSFHGDVQTFEYLVAQSDWDFVQIQLNYFDWKADNAETEYKILDEKGIPVIVMEPIRGGMLANLSPDANAILKKEAPRASAASWALRYCASLPSVLTILSGMNVYEHVVENINTLSSQFQPLSEREYKVVEESLRIFKQTMPILCTTCKYCMPCPFGVDIPSIFSFYNKCVNESIIPDFDHPDGLKYKKKKKAFLAEYEKIRETSNLNACTKCGKCMKKCPQRLPIPQELERINTLIHQIDK